MNKYMNVKTKKTNIGGGNTIASRRTYIHPLKDIHHNKQSQTQSKRKKTKKIIKRKKTIKRKRKH